MKTNGRGDSPFLFLSPRSQCGHDALFLLLLGDRAQAGEDGGTKGKECLSHRC